MHRIMAGIEASLDLAMPFTGGLDHDDADLDA